MGVLKERELNQKKSYDFHSVFQVEEAQPVFVKLVLNKNTTKIQWDFILNPNLIYI